MVYLKPTKTIIQVIKVIDLKHLTNQTREGTISGEIVGCACLRWLQGSVFKSHFTTDISVYFILKCIAYLLFIKIT